MSQKRPQTYSPIHKAVRQMLYSTAHAVGTTDLQDQASTKAMVDMVNEAIRKLEEHAGHEEKFVHPPLESRVLGITKAFDQNHRDHERVHKELEALGGQLEGASGDSRTELGKNIYGLFNRYVGEYLGHVDREEQQLEAALLQHFTDQELGAIEGGIMASIPPERMAAWLPYIGASMNPDEIAEMVGGVLHSAPPEVAQGMVKMFQGATPADTWARVQKRLG